MLKLLFTPEKLLPADAGFSLLGPQHLGMLALLALWSAAVLLWFRRLREVQLVRALRAMASVMLALEVLKDFVLAEIGAFSVGYLPLHLCSIAMFVCLYYCGHPKSDTCGQILYSVCFPGALCALLFPDWTNFPILHFQSLHSFIYHTLLVQFSLAPVVTGRVRPGLRHVWTSMAFLVLAALPVGAADRLLHTNSMFLEKPSPGSPLELLTVFPGHVGYLTGCFLLALGVILLWNLCYVLLIWIWKKKRKTV